MTSPPKPPPSPDQRGAPALPHHRVAVPMAFTLAVVVGFFACFAVWVNRQALNTANWTKTSGQLLANHQIDEALSIYLVNQLFSSVDVEHELEIVLPKEVQGLAGPVSSGLRLLANRLVPPLLATSQVQEAWRHANETAHKQLLAILNGGGSVVSTRSGVVSLNLHEVVDRLAGQLGVQNQVATAREKLHGATGEQVRAAAKQRFGINLPATTGQLVIMRSKQLRTAQDIAKAIRGLAIVLPLLSALLFALAVWLSRGRRRGALRTAGWCIFALGILLVLARRIAGDAIVDSLVSAPSNRPAAHAAWSIGTSLLYGLALAMVVYGLVFVAVAWLAGHARAAQLARRALAPSLRDHVVASYATAGAILLLLVLWGPTPATREVIPMIGLAVLAALGIRLLRAQTEVEFPQARAGETAAAVRVWWEGMRGRLAAHRTTGAAPSPANERLDSLERLAVLHERGVLTDAEFLAEKRTLLAHHVAPTIAEASPRRGVR
jgi:Short C-terminal domain